MWWSNAMTIRRFPRGYCVSLIFSFLFVTIGCLVATAQEAPLVKGKVVDQKGKALAQAPVLAIGPGGKQIYTVTNQNGEFAFYNLAPGKYTVVPAGQTG